MNVDKKKLQRIFKNARKEGETKGKDSSLKDEVSEKAQQIDRDS